MKYPHEIPQEVWKQIERDFAPVREKVESVVSRQPNSIMFQEAAAQVATAQKKS